jgi:hypothetical protein
LDQISGDNHKWRSNLCGVLYRWVEQGAGAKFDLFMWDDGPCDGGITGRHLPIISCAPSEEEMMLSLLTKPWYGHEWSSVGVRLTGRLGAILRCCLQHSSKCVSSFVSGEEPRECAKRAKPLNTRFRPNDPQQTAKSVCCKLRYPFNIKLIGS